MNDEMHIGPDGIEIIKQYEGFEPNLYNCPAGHCTIGYGHKVHDGPTDGRESERPFVGGLTEPQSHSLLLVDVAQKAEPYIKKSVSVVLNQHQFDALASFTYNLGGGNFLASTLLKKLNTGDYAGAGKEFPRWNKCNGKPLDGLTERREAERKLFLS